MDRTALSSRQMIRASNTGHGHVGHGVVAKRKYAKCKIDLSVTNSNSFYSVQMHFFDINIILYIPII